jgi:hypothetical protein
VGSPGGVQPDTKPICRSLSSYISYIYSPPHPISPSSFTLLFISETSIVAAYLTHLKRGIPIRAQRSTTSSSTITHLPIATMSYPVTPSIERTQDEMMASPRIQSADSPPMSPQMEQADIQSKHTTGMSPPQIRNLN